MTRHLVIEVESIKGSCPVYEEGDQVIIKGPEIDLEETDKLCTHALASLLHYVPALQKGTDPKELGLTKEGETAYIQCLDPGTPYTNGGTVIFRITRESQSSPS